jgi:hypothetical protein
MEGDKAEEAKKKISRCAAKLLRARAGKDSSTCSSEEGPIPISEITVTSAIASSISAGPTAQSRTL